MNTKTVEEKIFALEEEMREQKRLLTEICALQDRNVESIQGLRREVDGMHARIQRTQ